jgi:hypothetical protein
MVSVVSVSSGIKTPDDIDHPHKAYIAHITVARHRALVLYEAQPMTCYGCNGTEQLVQACPRRQGPRVTASKSTPLSWADMAAQRMEDILAASEEEEGIAP